ncbi:MAG: metFprotein [Rhizobiales bacterium]|nr:metFprotein [Hyphomicrobiales bacterium]
MSSAAAPLSPEAAKQAIVAFAKGFTSETTPASAAKIPDFREHLEPGSVVYITFLPGSDYLDTVKLAVRLRGEGMKPVPHFAARSVTSKDMLEDYLKRVSGEAGVDRVLCIGGAVAKPLGEYSDSMQMLGTGLFDKYGIKTIGVAGHPEGSPDFPEEEHLKAIAWKNAFAERTGAHLHIVTQFVFEAEPVIAWDKRLNASGNKMPIHIGVPGIATVKTLLNYAIACGVGNSINFIRRQAANVTRLLRPQAPDKLLLDLATYAATDPGCNVKGMHYYPLGGLRKTAIYARCVADGRFKMEKDGFTVDADLS